METNAMIDIKKDFEITVLIGNGFDLGLGLNTRFRDFYSNYIINKSGDECVLSFKQEIYNNIENWSDFEYQLGQYTKNFNEKDFEKFLDIKEDFENAFFNYLRIEQKKINYNNTQVVEFFNNAFKVDTILKQLPGIFADFFEKEIEESDMIVYKFINFNYTNTLEKIVETIKNYYNDLARLHPDELVVDEHDVLFLGTQHVHGSLKNDNCIIGVDNKTQIANESFAEITEILEYMVKPEINNVIQSGNEERAKQTIQESDVVIVYGLSMGETDNRWWKELIEEVINNDKKIIFFIHDEKIKITNCRQKRNYQNKYLAILSQVLNEDKEYLKKYSNNICFIFNKDIYEFDLTQQDEEVLIKTEKANVAI